MSEDEHRIVSNVSAPTNLFATTPLGVIDQATKIAQPLAKVLKEQKLAPEIQGRRYVVVEGWTLLGNMLGVFPRTVWTRRMTEEKRPPGFTPEGDPLPSLTFEGWEACVEAVTYSGAVIGRAEAQCTRAEAAWSYDPPLTKSGHPQKPRDDYALRAMAQTRATSRAMRGPLGFVVKLAGMEATAFEEMPHDA